MKKEKMLKVRSWMKEHKLALAGAVIGTLSVVGAVIGAVIAGKVKRMSEIGDDPNFVLLDLDADEIDDYSEQDVMITYRGKEVPAFLQDLGKDGVAFWVDHDDMKEVMKE